MQRRLQMLPVLRCTRNTHTSSHAPLFMHNLKCLCYICGSPNYYTRQVTVWHTVFYLETVFLRLPACLI